ncbi:MAG: hypothetical protein EBS87_12345, partial [Sphingomonadaceae bacterium]|nr:hypothetical protein [Sphingomonadaceae bacterium]
MGPRRRPHHRPFHPLGNQRGRPAHRRGKTLSDGGQHFSVEAAITRAEEMITEGVDIIDVGGESTKPGADRVTQAEELERVLPVIEKIVKLGTPISIDTTRSEVAKRAIKLGAQYVNDVSGGLADE